jgi:hypothetical protein
MDTKALLYGVVGFILGGLLVSVAATTFDKPVDGVCQMTSVFKSALSQTDKS